MLTVKFLIQFITIILAIIGAYLVAHTADALRARIDRNHLRAKVFLHDSFVKDNWKLLFLGSFFFLMNAMVNFNQISGLIIENESLELVRDITILGVLACSVASEYKWFVLIRPAKKFHISIGKSLIAFLALPFARAENGKKQPETKKSCNKKSQDSK